MNDYVSEGLNGVKNADFGNKIAEIADVEICLEQITHLLHCRATVDAWKEKKVERQLERIEKETRKGITV